MNETISCCSGLQQVEYDKIYREDSRQLNLHDDNPNNEREILLPQLQQLTNVALYLSHRGSIRSLPDS